MEKERLKIDRPIVLIGMTGCGKTTVGVALAERIGCQFLDIDKMIVDGEGKSISDIFAERGEAAFRDIETEYLKKALSFECPIIISPGGGVILRAENRALLRGNVCGAKPGLGTKPGLGANAAQVIWLIRERGEVIANPNVLNRPPIYGDPKNYDRIFAARKKYYTQAANAVIFNHNSLECAKTVYSWWKNNGINN